MTRCRHALTHDSGYKLLYAHVDMRATELRLKKESIFSSLEMSEDR